MQTTAQLLKKELPEVSKKLLGQIVREPKTVRSQPLISSWTASTRHFSSTNGSRDRVLPAEDYISWDTKTPVKIHMGESAPANQEPIRIQTMLKQTAEKYPDHLALTIKRDGVWKNWTYRQYLDQVERVGKAFHALGLKRHQGVGIMATNSPEWYISSLATIFAGGISSGIYLTNSPEMVSYVCDHAPMNILVLEDLETYDQVLGGRSLKEAFPTVETIVLLNGNSDGRKEIISWSELLDLGERQDNDVLEHIAQDQGANEAAMLLYTSGTTGPPKGKPVIALLNSKKSLTESVSIPFRCYAEP